MRITEEKEESNGMIHETLTTNPRDGSELKLQMNQLNRRRKKMKSFKQFDLNEDGQYTDRFTHHLLKMIMQVYSMYKTLNHYKN